MEKTKMSKLLSLFIILCGVSSFAFAHNLRMSVYVEGDNLEGELYYVGGSNPTAAGAPVELLAEGKVIATLVTDEDGWFVFEAVIAKDYQVRADVGQGHVATYEVSRNDFPNDAKTLADNTLQAADNSVGASLDSAAMVSEEQLQAALARAIRPLREQLDRYESKVRLHDILGGIGYIFGLFGLLVLYKHRRRSWS
ncbi:hypothetical protein [Thaumasiovibrio sp. DFM-14]|uniref:hypothetical protein n=1 Tax=Thaumasiovibrio sp. DFM-14 TaxID=3384792 RepID=UPI0039A20588